MPATLIETCLPEWKRPVVTAEAVPIAVVPGIGVGAEVVDGALDVLAAVESAFGVSFTVMRSGFVGAPSDHGIRLDDLDREFLDHAFSMSAPLLCGPVGGQFEDDLRDVYGVTCEFVPISPMPPLARSSIVRPGRVAAPNILLVQGDGIDVLPIAARAAMARGANLTVVVDEADEPAKSALWRQAAESRAAGSSALAVSDSALTLNVMNLDEAIFSVVADSDRFDVVVASCRLGRAVAASASLLLGSRNLSFSAGYGTPAAGEIGVAIHQSGHGPMRSLAGRDVANPLGMIRSLAFMLGETLRMPGPAAAIARAVAETLDAGLRTPDIADAECRTVGSREMAHAVASRVRSSAR